MIDTLADIQERLESVTEQNDRLKSLLRSAVLYLRITGADQFNDTRHFMEYAESVLNELEED